jgi:hypothetical protein
MIIGRAMPESALQLFRVFDRVSLNPISSTTFHFSQGHSMKLAYCLLLLGVATLLGCGKSSGFPPSSEWTRFNSPDAPYSVLLPSKPVRQVQESEDITVALHLCQIDENQGVITASNDLPPDIDLSDKKLVKLMFDEGIKACVNEMKGEIKEQKNLLIDGKYPARDCTAKIPFSKSQKGTARIRYVLIPEKLIQVIVIADDSEISSPEIKKCLDSINIKLEVD